MTPLEPTWYTTAQACQYLKVSDSTLYKYRKYGYLKAGIHWRNKFPDSPKSGVLYNIKACEKALIDMSRSHAETLELARS